MRLALPLVLALLLTSATKADFAFADAGAPEPAPATVEDAGAAAPATADAAPPPGAAPWSVHPFRAIVPEPLKARDPTLPPPEPPPDTPYSAPLQRHPGSPALHTAALVTTVAAAVLTGLAVYGALRICETDTHRGSFGEVVTSDPCRSGAPSSGPRHVSTALLVGAAFTFTLAVAGGFVVYFSAPYTATTSPAGPTKTTASGRDAVFGVRGTF